MAMSKTRLPFATAPTMMMEMTRQKRKYYKISQIIQNAILKLFLIFQKQHNRQFKQEERSVMVVRRMGEQTRHQTNETNL